MEVKSTILRLLNEEDKVLCSIGAEVHYDENNEFDEGDIYFIHPMTGNKCELLEQCFSGWAEQEEEKNIQWILLKRRIKNDKELMQKIWHDLEKIDYYI